MNNFLTLINNPIFVAVASALFTWVLTQITNRSAIKSHEKSQIMDRLLSERIKAYNELLAALSVFDEELTQVKYPANGHIPLGAHKAAVKLHYVFLAHKLWISKSVRDIYRELQDNIELIKETRTEQGILYEANDLATIRIRSAEILSRLLEAIKKDLDLEFFDRWIYGRLQDYRPLK
jgi:hypothetical protein